MLTPLIQGRGGLNNKPLVAPRGTSESALDPLPPDAIDGEWNANLRILKR